MGDYEEAEQVSNQMMEVRWRNGDIAVKCGWASLNCRVVWYTARRPLIYGGHLTHAAVPF